MNNQRAKSLTRLLCLVVVGVLLSACATTAPTPGVVSDPFEPVNRSIYEFNDKIDRYALKPIATGYRKITPSIVRVGINNFFGNIGDVSTAANGILQGKFKQGLSDTGRVVVNTIIGFGGFIDVASQLDFEKHYEDFGQTLGVWGIAEGPYLVLPFFGPQTLRSTVGLVADSTIEPLNTIEMSNQTRGALVTINVLNARANLLAASSLRDSGALDPYRFVRDRYIGWRRKQVNSEPMKKPSVITSDKNLDELNELEELDMLDDLDDELDELEMLDNLDDEEDTPTTGNSDELRELEKLDEI